MAEKKVLFEICDLTKTYPLSKGFLRKKSLLTACDGVTFDLYEGETFGLVGESGCGKSTLGRTLLRLILPTSGEVVYHGSGEGVTLGALSEKQMRALRKEMQIVFQDPYSSLNPQMTVGESIGEGLLAHGLYEKGSVAFDGRVREVALACGIQPSWLGRYPHQFSGGQRQRVCIARALATRPKFVVCDECVSALDVSVQAQIMSMLSRLKRGENLTYLFITHDLGVVRYLADRVGVMYRGRLIEIAPTGALFRRARHPYTQALFAAAPTLFKRESRVERKEARADGCAYYEKCPYAKEICWRQSPDLLPLGRGRFSACHFAKEKEFLPQKEG